MPLCIEEACADIALVFGWSLGELYGLSFADLMTWHKLAIERFKIKAQALGGG